MLFENYCFRLEVTDRNIYKNLVVCIHGVNVTVKVGFLKLGNIASSPMLEFLLDERAEREDIDVRVVGSGAKLGPSQAEEIAEKLLELNPDLVILTSPNASLKGPMKAVEKIAGAGKPLIVVSDPPALKAKERYEELGVGYIIVEADSMIGARREFLDPAEMALFNANAISLLACSGALNLLFNEIDKVIDSIKKGEKPELPRIKVTAKKAVEAAGFQNPYAKAKAMAAYEMAKNVAPITVKACFMEKDWEKYTLLCAEAHELMQAAAALALEAREIEKYGDTLRRTPHYDDGTILDKRKLIEKPRKPE